VLGEWGEERRCEERGKRRISYKKQTN